MHDLHGKGICLEKKLPENASYSMCLQFILVIIFCFKINFQIFFFHSSENICPDLFIKIFSLLFPFSSIPVKTFLILLKYFDWHYMFLLIFISYFVPSHMATDLFYSLFLCSIFFFILTSTDFYSYFLSNNICAYFYAFFLLKKKK